MNTKRKPSASSLAASPPAAQDNVWLAGLGALAQAQARGSEAFDALVREGIAQQTKARETAQAELSKAAERLTTLTGGASVTPWDRLGVIFETRVAQALERMGMPTPQAMGTLLARIDALEQRIAALEHQLPAAPANPNPKRGKTRTA
ncbi:MAG: phasin family protein [Ottowia sp.]|jgi:poly(hydroxyalkanoate) granule-associated protein|nr:phasin family protein [Ottowia sp.]